MENDDKECFKWAVTSALNRIREKPFLGTASETLSCPSSEELRNDAILSQFRRTTPCLERVFNKFEKNNNVSLLVFGHEASINNTYIIPLYVPTERREKIVRLFFFKKDEGEDGIPIAW